MTKEDKKFISSQKMSDLIHLPATLVIEWLSHQSDFMGETVAKACYQSISTNNRSFN